MRRLLVVLPSVVCVATLLASCGKDPAPPASSEIDTGFPIFDSARADSGTPSPDSGTPGPDSEPVDTGAAADSTVVDSGMTADSTFSDITSTKDSNIGDVIKLTEGGPPDVPPDTDLPDALSIDTAPLDTARPTD